MSNLLAIRPSTWTPNAEAAFDMQANDLNVHLEIVQGFDEVADVRGEDLEIPDREGVLPGSRVKVGRSIEYKGHVQGPIDVAESARMSGYRTLVLALQATFDPTKQGVLSVDGEDGATYTIPARPARIVFGPEDVPGRRDLSVAFTTTTDPDWTRTP